MDYVSNDFTVVKEKRQDEGAAVLAYDMAMAEMNNVGNDEALG